MKFIIATEPGTDMTAFGVVVPGRNTGMYDDPAGLRRCVGPGSVPALRRCPELPERAVQRPLYSVPGVWP